MEPLDLPRDPTLRITFPEDEERDDNALKLTSLGSSFKTWIGSRRSTHWVAVLAFTGLGVGC
jgi:hypothetical protein